MNKPTKTNFRMIERLFVVTALAIVACVNQANAHGEMEDHVKQLEKHLPEYSKSVQTFLDNVEGVVESYAAGGAKTAESVNLPNFWEEAKIHLAIELNHAPIYASVWQGIYSVKNAIESGKSLDAVRREQAALEQAMWQALGAVKMAAKVQSQKGADSKSSGTAPTPKQPGQESEPAGPVATIDVIKHQLDDAVSLYAEDHSNDAKSLVHATYLNRFEGGEGPLIEQDAALVQGLEKDFNVTLPKQLEEGASLKKVRQTVEKMRKKLDRARDLLSQAEEEKKDVF